jgi:hypothetical protein
MRPGAGDTDFTIDSGENYKRGVVIFTSLLQITQTDFVRWEVALRLLGKPDAVRPAPLL